eukprot:3453346-Alexandrium_andersonii.AAC.1
MAAPTQRTTALDGRRGRWLSRLWAPVAARPCTRCSKRLCLSCSVAVLPSAPGCAARAVGHALRRPRAPPM